MMSEETIDPETVSALPPRVEEARLLEIAAELPGKTITAISTGRAQAAEQLALARPDATVSCWYIDAYRADKAILQIGQLPNLTVQCCADWPDHPCDLALLPLSVSGEAELSRELMQQAYSHLTIGGHLITSVDNAKDKWLHEQMKTFEKSVKVRSFDDANVYFVQKTAELKKQKDFSCELAFKDCDVLIKLVTRPGVFSHRQLDNGARQLLDAVDVYPQARLIDIGCGSGAVAIGAAMREPSATVMAIDSSARAIDCTQRGVRLNGLENVEVRLNHDGQLPEESSFDMALANPPYYADFRIAERFLATAHRVLRPGGRLVLVTKQPNWYREHLPELFEDVEVFESRRYWIASGVKS